VTRVAKGLLRAFLRLFEFGLGNVAGLFYFSVAFIKITRRTAGVSGGRCIVSVLMFGGGEGVHRAVFGVCYCQGGRMFRYLVIKWAMQFTTRSSSKWYNRLSKR
jgi:hypothetical protein